MSGSRSPTLKGRSISPDLSKAGNQSLPIILGLLAQELAAAPLDDPVLAGLAFAQSLLQRLHAALELRQFELAALLAQVEQLGQRLLQLLRRRLTVLGRRAAGLLGLRHALPLEVAQLLHLHHRVLSSCSSFCQTSSIAL